LSYSNKTSKGIGKILFLPGFNPVVRVKSLVFDGARLLEGSVKKVNPLYFKGILACRRFGPQNPQLWVTALQYVAGSDNGGGGGVAEVPPHYFKEVLDSIEQHRLLSPLQVVTTLSTCPTATLGVVR
jgi:hypothetical protein